MFDNSFFRYTQGTSCQLKNIIMELELEKLNLPCDSDRPLIIAGPCSAETEEQVMQTAQQLAQKGCHILAYTGEERNRYACGNRGGNTGAC